MNHLGKIVMAALVSLSAGLSATEAKADDRDGTIERYVCIRDASIKDGLESEYVELQNQSVGLGFGGTNVALRLSNDGNKGSGLGKESYAGGTATFTPQKQENQIEIYFKPFGIPRTSVSVDICVRTPTGENFLAGSLNTFTIRPTKAGWFIASEDLDTFNNEFRGAIVQKIAVRLNAAGDTGSMLLGNMRVLNRKDVVDPSLIVTPLQPCGADPIRQPCTGN